MTNQQLLMSSYSKKEALDKIDAYVKELLLDPKYFELYRRIQNEIYTK